VSQTEFQNLEINGENVVREWKIIVSREVKDYVPHAKKKSERFI
jgi:hypothetical protein